MIILPFVSTSKAQLVITQHKDSGMQLPGSGMLTISGLG